MSSQALKAAATGAATPTEARNPYEGLKRQLEGSKGEFLPLLGQSQANVDKFIRVVLNAVLATPELLEVNRRTLINASMRAAQDGLLPDGREAVLNIYNTKTSKRGEPDRWEKCAQYLPMVGGLIKKLYESGEVTYVDAACVYEGDKFTFKRGEEPKLEHEPTMVGAPGDIIAAYCVVKLKNGEVKREVMPRRDIDKVRAASKSRDNGPWVTWFDQQAIKSVIKRIYKQLPRADAFESIADADNIASGYVETLGGVVVPSIDSMPAAPPPPALGHTEPDPITFDVGQGQMEDESPDALEAKAKATAKFATAPATSGSTPPPFDPAKMLERMQKAGDRDTLALLADDCNILEDGPAKDALFAAYRIRDAELAKGAK